MEAEDEEAEVTQKLEDMELQDNDSVFEVPVVVDASSVEEEEPQGNAIASADGSIQLELTEEDSEDQRPKTAYFDGGFPEAPDNQESAEELQETLIDEKIDEKLDSPEAETPVVENRQDHYSEESAKEDDKDKTEKATS